MSDRITLLETDTHCGCWWYYGVDHPDRADCWPFLFKCEVADSFAVTECHCCGRQFLISGMMVEPGDDSVGLGELYLCLWCASEECDDSLVSL